MSGKLLFTQVSCLLKNDLENDLMFTYIPRELRHIVLHRSKGRLAALQTPSPPRAAQPLTRVKDILLAFLRFFRDGE